MRNLHDAFQRPLPSLLPSQADRALTSVEARGSESNPCCGPAHWGREHVPFSGAGAETLKKKKNHEDAAWANICRRFISALFDPQVRHLGERLTEDPPPTYPHTCPVAPQVPPHQARSPPCLSPRFHEGNAGRGGTPGRPARAVWWRRWGRREVPGSAAAPQWG